MAFPNIDTTSSIRRNFVDEVIGIEACFAVICIAGFLFVLGLLRERDTVSTTLYTVAIQKYRLNTMLLYNLFSFILDVVAGLFAGVLLLRCWTQIVRVRPPQSIAQFIFQLTDWLIRPLRRVLPGVGGIDWASLLAVYIIAFICSWLKFWVISTFFSSLIFLLALFSMLQWMIYGWIALLILEVIFSWINPHAPLAPFVQALNAPLLRPIRRVLPSLGGLDLSPLALFLILQVLGTTLTYIAAELVPLFR